MTSKLGCPRQPGARGQRVTAARLSLGQRVTGGRLSLGQQAAGWLRPGASRSARWPPNLLAALLSVVMAATVGWVATDLWRDRARLATGAVGSGPRPARVPLGAFLGSDATGVARIGGFQGWLHRIEVTVGRSYLPGATWADLEGPDWVLDPWTAWRAQRPERMLALNVPMVAGNESGRSDPDVAARLREGAAGRYDQHFAVLADRLVARHAADTVIVLGWEMNGTTYAGRCGPDPQAWREYWRRIVTAMRAVPGAQFRFDFAPARGAQGVPWPWCYPGDDVVDIIGMDSYDQEPGSSFSDFVQQPYGLQAQVDFAAGHGKPVSYPEWGLYDYGDNAAYVREMYRWINTHNVAYQSITDYCPHGVWRDSCNVVSGQEYRRLFETG